MKLPEPPQLRPLNRDDESERNLVLAGFMRTYGRSFDPRFALETPVLFKMLAPIVMAIVERSEVTVAVDDGAVTGWLAVEGDTLHYCAVKPRWQRLGVATYLLARYVDRAMTFTHQTADGRKLLEALAPASWSYKPMARFEVAA